MEDKALPELDPDKEFELLLPLYFRGALDGEELAKVESHLNQCATCQQILADEERFTSLMEYILSGRQVPHYQNQWDRFKEKLPHPTDNDSAVHICEAATQKVQPWRSFRAFWGQPRQMKKVIWFQAAAIAAMAFFLVPNLVSEPIGEYQTLSSEAAGAASSATVVVQFAPDTAEEQLRTILQAFDARLVDGPMATNAYIVRVDGAQRGEFLQHLRSQKAVIMAEAIDPKNAP